MADAPAPAVRGHYHHGSLREAMIAAAEEVLAERGLGGFTLRECARRAGVSPAAPAHHFGNLTGLLTAIATLGFIDLGTAMEAAVATAQEQGRSRLAAIACAYVETALANPGRFRVVFGQRGIDREDVGCQMASGRAFGILLREVRSAAGRPPLPAMDQKPPANVLAPDLPEVLLAWSAVHGFSTLLIDGALDFLNEGSDREAFVDKHAARLFALLASVLHVTQGLAKADARD
ncbi:TetR/AcrR family transcriptional regulator [Bosea beijingensis]|jgi:AcrR family transcriptional regulator